MGAYAIPDRAEQAAIDVGRAGYSLPEPEMDLLIERREGAVGGIRGGVEEQTLSRPRAEASKIVESTETRAAIALADGRAAELEGERHKQRLPALEDEEAETEQELNLARQELDKQSSLLHRVGEYLNVRIIGVIFGGEVAVQMTSLTPVISEQVQLTESWQPLALALVAGLVVQIAGLLAGLLLAAIAPARVGVAILLAGIVVLVFSFFGHLNDLRDGVDGQAFMTDVSAFAFLVAVGLGFVRTVTTSTDYLRERVAELRAALAQARAAVAACRQAIEACALRAETALGRALSEIQAGLDAQIELGHLDELVRMRVGIENEFTQLRIQDSTLSHRMGRRVNLEDDEALTLLIEAETRARRVRWGRIAALVALLVALGGLMSLILSSLLPLAVSAVVAAVLVLLALRAPRVVQPESGVSEALFGLVRDDRWVVMPRRSSGGRSDGGAGSDQKV